MQSRRDSPPPWLRLQDVSKVHPDAFLSPEFPICNREMMERRHTMFFGDIVRVTRNVLDLFHAELQVREPT